MDLADISPDALKALRDLWAEQSVNGATSDMVYAVLFEGIVSWILRPGQRLGEEPLARAFDISRTPVREALLRLEAERLAERVPRRGLVVSRVTPQDIIDVYVVREAIDGLAAYLAAQNATPADISRLSWINDQFAAAAEAGDVAEMARLNLQFHEAIAEIARNALLVDLVHQIHRRVRRFRTSTFAQPTRPVAAVQAHRRLIEAIKQGQAEQARQIAMADMALARQARIDMLQDEFDES